MESPTATPSAAPGESGELLEHIHRHLANGELGAARLALRQADARWPGHPAFAEARIAWHLANGDDGPAATLARLALARHPDRVRLLELFVEAVLRLGGVAPALESILGFGQPLPRNLMIRGLECRLRLNQPSQALEDVARWLQAHPDSTGLRALLNGLPEDQFDARELARAIAELGCKRWPDDAALRLRAARLAMAGLRWRDAQAHLSRFAMLAPDDVRHRVHLANVAFFENGDMDVAIEAATQALARDPGLVAMRLLAAHAFYLQGNRAQAVAMAQAGLEHSKCTQDQSVAFASLVTADSLDDARVESPKQGDGAFVLVRHGVQVHIPARARAVALYLGSVNFAWSLGFSALRGMIPHDVGLIYLQDFGRLFFLNGVASLAPDYAGTVEALRAMLPATRPELLCIGFSGGAYSAMHYGPDLGATRLLLFSPPTDGREEAMTNRGLATRYRRIQAAVPGMLLDMREVFEARGNWPQMDLWYGLGLEFDRRNADRFAGMDRVRLHPVAGCGHDVVGYLRSTGQFEEILRDWLGRHG